MRETHGLIIESQELRLCLGMDALVTAEEAEAEAEAEVQAKGNGVRLVAGSAESTAGAGHCHPSRTSPHGF